MANQARALKVLKQGGWLINGLICLPGGGLDLTSKGRLTSAQLKSLEKKNVVPSDEGGAIVHRFKG